MCSPALYTIYTNDCQSSNPSVPLIKFADDCVLQGLISNDETLYKLEVANFVSWCDENFLQLNVNKTKELIIDFRQKKEILTPICIKSQNVEIVESYKYLGVTVDEKLNWNEHTHNVSAKINRRLFFIRKLRSFHVDNTLIHLFYTSTIQSIICFCISCWGGNASAMAKTQINRAIRKSHKISNTNPVHYFQELFEVAVQKKFNVILSNSCHPLANQIQRSLRSGRVISLPAKRSRYLNSFLPSAVRMYIAKYY